MTRVRLLAEFLLLYGGIPMILLYEKQRMLMLGILWLGALGIHFFLSRTHKIGHAEEMNWQGFREGIRTVLIRFAVLAPLIALATWLCVPELFLSFPLQRPGFWLLVMVLYPLLSVWPQELAYRSFLYHRYAPVFGKDAGYIAASALAFGYVHLMFLNWIAPVMTLAGGGLFAHDYARRRSLALVCAEHALYGCLIFTVGLGRYFFTGAAWHHQ